MDKQENLAMEMLRELKQNAKRWFIVSVIELVILIATILLFIGYINTPIEETTETTYSQDANTEGDSSTINQNIN